MDDGSAIVGEIMEEVTVAAEVPFGANLAEFIDDGDLGVIASELSSDIEDDMSSRQDWEDSYKRGIELLGMSYEERSQPFEGATGVVHPLLAESVTQFQAKAYREMLPSMILKQIRCYSIYRLLVQHLRRCILTHFCKEQSVNLYMLRMLLFLMAQLICLLRRVLRILFAWTRTRF